jgi:hypothetical protein
MISYRIDFEAVRSHLLRVTLTVPEPLATVSTTHRPSLSWYIT